MLSLTRRTGKPARKKKLGLVLQGAAAIAAY
jgi:hypothetical protein